MVFQAGCVTAMSRDQGGQLYFTIDHNLTSVFQHMSHDD